MVKFTDRNAATAMPKLQCFNGAKVRYVFLAGRRKVVGDSADRLFKL
jgi:hypothetical protein